MLLMFAFLLLICPFITGLQWGGISAKNLEGYWDDFSSPATSLMHQKLYKILGYMKTKTQSYCYFNREGDQFLSICLKHSQS